MADFTGNKVKFSKEELKEIKELLKQADTSFDTSRLATIHLGNMYRDPDVLAAAKNDVYGGDPHNVPYDIAEDLYTSGNLDDIYNKWTSFSDAAPIAFKHKFRDSKVNPNFLKSLLKNQDGYFFEESLLPTINKYYQNADEDGFLEYLANMYEDNKDFKTTFDSGSAFDKEGTIRAWYEDFLHKTEGAKKLQEAAESVYKVNPEAESRIPVGIPSNLQVIKGDPQLNEQYEFEDTFEEMDNFLNNKYKNSLGYLK